jgi:hypothetical protein
MPQELKIPTESEVQAKLCAAFKRELQSDELAEKFAKALSPRFYLYIKVITQITGKSPQMK